MKTTLVTILAAAAVASPAVRDLQDDPLPALASLFEAQDPVPEPHAIPSLAEAPAPPDAPVPLLTSIPLVGSMFGPQDAPAEPQPPIVPEPREAATPTKIRFVGAMGQPMPPPTPEPEYLAQDAPRSRGVARRTQDPRLNQAKEEIDRSAAAIAELSAQIALLKAQLANGQSRSSEVRAEQGRDLDTIRETYEEAVRVYEQNAEGYTEWHSSRAKQAAKIAELQAKIARESRNEIQEQLKLQDRAEEMRRIALIQAEEARAQARVLAEGARREAREQATAVREEARAARDLARGLVQGQRVRARELAEVERAQALEEVARASVEVSQRRSREPRQVSESRGRTVRGGQAPPQAPQAPQPPKVREFLRNAADRTAPAQNGGVTVIVERGDVHIHSGGSGPVRVHGNTIEFTDKPKDKARSRDTGEDPVVYQLPHAVQGELHTYSLPRAGQHVIEFQPDVAEPEPALELITFESAPAAEALIRETQPDSHSGEASKLEELKALIMSLREDVQQLRGEIRQLGDDARDLPEVESRARGRRR